MDHTPDGITHLVVARTVFACALALTAQHSQATDDTSRDSNTFARICAHCHVREHTTAPMLGDHREWQRRSADGFESLVRNTVVGIGNMPPLGTCGYCTEAELRRLVTLLTGIPDPYGDSQ